LGKPAGRIWRSSEQLPDRRSLTRRCDYQDGWTHSVHPHPRSRHNVVRLFPQCSWMVRQVPHALPQWRSCRGYRGIIPRLLRGCPCPGARDGASVQFYISTVIEDHRKICRNINFVVEMSDSGVYPGFAAFLTAGIVIPGGRSPEA